MKRPIGVTILAIINGLSTLVLGLIGISAFFAGPVLDQLMQDPELAELHQVLAYFHSSVHLTRAEPL